MKRGGISTLVLGLCLISAHAAYAAKPARCHAEVLRSEELPYAPVGSWLLKATIRITYPGGASAISTVFKNAPWQTTLRRGDTFWFNCERIKDAWFVSEHKQQTAMPSVSPR